MSEAQLTSYEEIPYESKPLYPTHPDCLGALATLMGMKPASVDRCRVLELGCASGGNLIPMAEALPGSHFLGIDLSPGQIKTGQAAVQALGLQNIDLRPLSILDIDDSFGQFDYIICHGVYSWVPASVQDKILTICSRHLTEGGVAYVSYNTLPGWHQRAAVREMMGYHVRRFSEPKMRVEQARAFLKFLIDANPKPDSTYCRLLREEADLLRRAADSYVFHEHLEDANYPVYFSQFMEGAAAKGLQYLGEAWYHMRLANLPDEVQSTLQDLSEGLIQLEQYLDFLHNRTFRRTLLCHQNVRLNRTPAPDVLARFYLTALARPVSAKPKLESAATETFTLDDGTTASTNDPQVKAALTVLYEAWPRAISFEALWSAVRGRLAGIAPDGSRPSDTGPQLLAEAVLRCYLANLLALHIHPFHFVLEAGERPIASPLARLQAASSDRVTNRRHRLVELDDLDRVVLQLLDGSRDREAVVHLMRGLAAKNVLALASDEEASSEKEPSGDALSAVLESCLGRLAKNGLLIA
jgi:methyltransferase-like protein/2-polyprenyl-3-methyl-5-hydroxy-6-metoxy-1,4-benzoquinol methylase